MLKHSIYCTFSAAEALATQYTKQIKKPFSLKPSFPSFELFAENLQRARAWVDCFIICHPFGSFNKYHITTVSKESVTVPLNHFHGSSNLELESRQLNFQNSFVHHLEH
jgi:hypothetical protein